MYRLTLIITTAVLASFFFEPAAPASILDIPPTSTCAPGLESGRQIDNALTQLTGAMLRPGQTQYPYSQFSDPAPPFFSSDGSVEIYGPGDFFIRYANRDEFESGGCFMKIPLAFVDSRGEQILDTLLQPWDVRKLMIRYHDGREEQVLIGSVMSPSGGRDFPIWPDDNSSRRIYLFHADANGSWVRSQESIFGRAADGWIGHSYGGNFLQENSVDPNLIDFQQPGRIGFFYERVSRVENNFPLTTELFMQTINETLQANGVENSVLHFDSVPYASTRRVLGGYLSEGPRPFAIQLHGAWLYMVAFSSGDYPTDSYTTNFVWSDSLVGPYRPILTTDGFDLKDFGEPFKSDYALSWVGRPSPYVAPDGSLAMLFHAVEKELVPAFDYKHWPAGPDADKIFRVLFRTRLQLDLNSSGEPVVQIGKTPSFGDAGDQRRVCQLRGS